MFQPFLLNALCTLSDTISFGYTEARGKQKCAANFFQLVAHSTVIFLELQRFSLDKLLNSLYTIYQGISSGAALADFAVWCLLTPSGIFFICINIIAHFGADCKRLFVFLLHILLIFSVKRLFLRHSTWTIRSDAPAAAWPMPVRAGYAACARPLQVHRAAYTHNGYWYRAPPSIA